ncbi:hypothetical protein [Pedobacter sp. L105]|uniref:hypothetical protein n=1 Tax=Pedobacter sp. L105 TaxID=1641871 RepID=UPI00131D15AD|nr:hypothetical protein [Pedobacter sp. L105]
MRFYSKRQFLLLCIIIGSIQGYAQMSYPGLKPGAAAIKKSGNQIDIENSVLRLSFQVNNGKITAGSFEDKEGHQQVALRQAPLFELTLAGGKVISSNDFTLVQTPEIISINGEPNSEVEASKKDGKKYSADLENTRLGLKIHWEASLHNGANYIRQLFTFMPNDSVKILKITLIKLPAAGIKIEGTVDGSPLVYHNLFFSVEHPMSQTLAGKSFITAYLPRLEAIHAGAPLSLSSVWGTTPAGQLRRGFLYYVENERAHPYRQVLHYNSWFDLSWQDRKMNEKDCLDRIQVFKDSLIDKRNVKMDAFLFDDGWDDNKTLWQFNSGFPDGFSKMTAAAKAAGAGIGVWISPWGGYDDPKIQRLAFGKKQSPPFETNENGFSLTGPVYNRRFREVTTSFIKNYNVSMFKFDGVGAGNGASGASITYQKDIEAFLKLITALRTEKPDLYLSLTVGTWPSVYWLNYGDAIWRAGEDTGLAGDGPKRQQWITYKDAQAYQNIVKRGPLFPLNAIMYHGICIAENGLPGKLEMDNKNIADEIWAFFGTGTGLQELYVNPHLLNTADWDCLKKAANWSKAHKKALADIHWVGGNPVKGEVYGYAGWADQKGVMTLRNPTGLAKTFTVNVKQALDIPGSLTDNYQFFDARGGDKVYKGRSFQVKLAPYEVKVMDAKTL